MPYLHELCSICPVAFPHDEGSIMATSVLLIGNTLGKYKELTIALTKKYTTHIVSSGKQALAFLKKNSAIQIIILDANSMNTSGTRITVALKRLLPQVPIIHIQSKDSTSTKSQADVIMQGQISGRRLINSIERILHNANDEVLNVGPFVMNITRRILVAHGKETQLTPKQAQLVETFLRNPGKTLGRKHLMEHVWETDYLGDTRTLDVHIRWIRKIIEKNSKQPRYLKTVRGIGYQLSLPEEQ